MAGLIVVTTDIATMMVRQTKAKVNLLQDRVLMGFDLPRFYKACNPSKTLNVGNSDDRAYYIDFSPVRGGSLVRELNRTIALLSPDMPTCQLFTGHIGCGKSTELLFLKETLEQQGFHVVYFESSEDLDMADVDITDILLAIARRVSSSFEEQNIKLDSRYFVHLFNEINDLLRLPISIDEQSLSIGISRITAQTKNSPSLRTQLRQYLEPRTNGIIESLNQEILYPGTQALHMMGRQGLVILVDNLDRVSTRPTSFGRSLPQYLFVDRGEQLRSLHCHVVYTIPLVLLFSNDLGMLTNRFGVEPKVLPMVPVKLRDGRDYQPGLNLLQQMILARAFPTLPHDECVQHLTQIFDSPETCNRLCRTSGGHIRNLLVLLSQCIKREDTPLSHDCVESVIKQRQSELTLAITEDEWELINQVRRSKAVRGENDSRALLRSMFVFEYRDEQGSWFDINPALLA